MPYCWSSYSLAVAEELKARDDTLAQLFEQREEMLTRVVEIARAQYLQGTGSLESLQAAEEALLEAKLDSATDREERLTILKAQLRLARAREERVAQNVDVAAASPKDLIQATIARLNVQIALERERHRE